MRAPPIATVVRMALDHRHRGHSARDLDMSSA